MKMNSETNNNANARGQQPIGTYRPKLTFYHPTAKGTGCAATWALHPAHDDTDGSIWLRVANQMTVGNRMGPNPTYPRFDWENPICVKLDFSDLCAFLQVFRGECESINGDHGLYHRSASGSTSIRLRHMIDPVSGYSLELYRMPAGGGEEMRARMLLTPTEALGLSEAIAGALYLVGFGIPMLVPHDTSAYRAQTKEVRNAAA